MKATATQLLQRGDGPSGYLCEEMKALREMILMTVKEINSLQNISLVTSGAIYAFAVSQIPTVPSHLLLIVVSFPFVINVLNYLHCEGMMRDCKEMRKYIERIETQLLPEGLGYSQYYTDHRTTKSGMVIRYTRRLFWWILITVSIAAPILWSGSMSEALP